MFLQLTNKIKNLLENHYQTEFVIEVPKRGNSDLAIPLFRFAKEKNIPIADIANEIMELLKAEPMIESMQFDRGFLNMFINRAKYTKNVLKEIDEQQDNYGTLKEVNKVVCIDYSSPNIAKNFSVGHLRSTVIGAALYKIYEKRGYKAIGINHLGDWGTQFGKMIIAYKMWGDEAGLKNNPIDYLQNLYVKFHEEEKLNPKLEDEARAAFKSLEDGDLELTKLWEQFKELSVNEFMNMYELLDVSFDHYQGEAFYNDKMDRVVNELEEKNLLVIDDGASVVLLDEFDMPPALIKRKDGATLYITRDLAALFYRHENYHFDKMLYVVGNEQKLHFRQLLETTNKMGYHFDIEHVNFGLVLIDGKKMTTRGGNVVNLYDVINEAIDLAYQSILEKNPTLENKEDVAKAIGVSAVIFNDLKNDRNLDIDFNLEQMLSFEGLTGPYVQYSSVRIYSILKNQNIGLLKDESVYEQDLSFQLVMQLSQFSQILDRALEENGPHIISRYLLNLAQTFNQFYGAHKVIVEDEKMRNANLYLIKAVRTVLNEGMRLLGMQVLNEM